MSAIEEKFDLLVIGAGPGGYVCAIRAAQLGMKVGCIEASETLGGTCLNVGCIPSKALLESSHHFHQVKNELDEHGIKTGTPTIDIDTMLKRKDKVVDSMTQGVSYLFKKNKVAWIKGFASLLENKKIEVTLNDGSKKFYEASSIVIASGSKPIEIPSAKFDHKKIVDSTDALSFSETPNHLTIIGGGVIGLELGSIWSRLGAKVTVIEALDHILGNTDLQTSKEMLKLLKRQGLSFHLKTKLEKTEIKSDGTVQITCDSPQGPVNIEADKVLVAVGRKPFTHNMGLENAGIKLNPRGFIEVDGNYKSSVPGIYAIGDVTPGPMLAHKAEEEGIAVAEHLSGKTSHINYDAIPSIVYTWPELASVGKSEEQCKIEKIPFNIGKFFFKANGRARAMGSSDGFVKIIAHKESDKLLGVHIVGPLASEMIAEAALAFEYGASAEDIARSVHAHPTLAEVFKEAALDVDKRAIHS